MRHWAAWAVTACASLQLETPIRAQQVPPQPGMKWTEEQLLKAVAPHRVEWHWVKGHSGHTENDRVDALACAEADARR